MKTTIREKIESKTGTDYEMLFNNFKEKYPRSRRAFYVLKETIKHDKGAGIYATGLKIENKNGKFVATQKRMSVNDTCYEIVK